MSMAFPSQLLFHFFFLFIWLSSMQTVLYLEPASHNKIFRTKNPSPMYNISNLTQLYSLENQECSCFGNSSHPRDQFLVKQAQSKPMSLSNSQIAPIDQSFTKSGAKRSLRRPNPTYFPQKNKERTMEMHESSSRQLLSHTYSTKQLAQFTSPQRIRHNYPQNSPLLHQEAPYTPYPSPQNFHPLHRRQQTFSSFPLPTQMRPIFIGQPVAGFNFAPFQPVSPVKVIYNKQIPEVSANIPVRTQAFTREEVCKEERSHTNASRNEPNSLTSLQRQTISTQPITRPQFLEPIPLLQRNDANSVNSEPSQNIALSPSNNEQQQFFFQQDFNPEALKYSWQLQINTTPKDFDFPEPTRLSWQLPHDRHKSLKKMNDVEEICSQPDSQEDSNSGKESIVVGRLNEYASMVEPKAESTSMIDQNVQNRLTGIGSLNSTVGNGKSKKKDQIFV